MKNSKKEHTNKKRPHDDDSDNDDDQDDDDKSENSDANIDNSPKCIPTAKLPDKLKSKKIIINISDTQYPIVEEISEELGWVIQRKQGKGNWDVWWTDRQIHPQTLIKMNFHQKINHYAGIQVLARKNLLGLNLMAMQEHFPVEYNFFPQTWTIPLEFPKFRAYFQSCPKGKTRTYIVKPQAWSQGRGIFLTRNIDDISNGQKYVVQRYVKNPYLIDGLKFDLRIYVLLAGTDPLRLYIYEEGLTRLATKKYEQPTQQNLHTSFIHLTNYSLNKHNPNFVYNTSADNMNVGHKRTLSSTYDLLAKKGVNVDKLKEEINDVIIKTFISGLPTIAHQYQACQPQEYESNMCFHIIGVDIMLTADLKPILIELNHTPSFQTETPLDYKVKKSLIHDTLKLMRITSKKKKQLFQKAKTTLKKRIQTGKRDIAKGDQRKLFVKEAQKIRDVEEANRMGGYTRIYPCKEQDQKQQIYYKMIERAEDVHKSTQQQRKKLIREEQQRLKAVKKAASQEAENNGKKIGHGRKFHSTSMTTQKETSNLHESMPVRNPTPDIFKSSKNNSYCPRSSNDSDLRSREQVSHNILHGGNKKNMMNSKRKNKMFFPAVDPIQQRQEVIKFSDYMQRYLMSSSPNKIGFNGNSLPEIGNCYCNYQQINDNKKNSQQNIRDDRFKPGAFVVPRTYNIVDSNYCSIQKIVANPHKESQMQRKSNNMSNMPTYTRHMRGLESYKQIVRKKKQDNI